MTSWPSTSGTNLPSTTYHYLSLALRECRPAVIFGSLLLLFALYVAWRALVIWHEVRLERKRLRENFVWMQDERKRRAAKTVGILTARERREARGAMGQEQMLKRVRFAEMIEGSVGGDASVDTILEGQLVCGESVLEQPLDEGLEEERF